jgi:hypothetical protein
MVPPISAAGCRSLGRYRGAAGKLLQSPRMADWRQVQARIRKAKSGSDPAAQLADLYQRTHDAMVAFELAQWHEKAGNASDTVQWYTTAAQRFRRAQWRIKAEEALTRLGAPLPAPGQPEPAGDDAAGRQSEESASTSAHIPYESSMEANVERQRLRVSDEEESSPPTQAEKLGEEGEEEERPAATANSSTERPGTGKRRRRGRRGGRKRRGRVGAVPQAGSSSPSAEASPAAEVARPVSRYPETSSAPSFDWSEGEPSAGREATPLPAETHFRGGVGGFASSRPRTGDPGLSSRIAQLESQLRRLLACPLAGLDDSDNAPAGPGVLLLSDSDQVTHYFVESCQTLRIAVGNLLRGGRGSKGGAQLKSKLADHLGINESRVSKYLKDHCAVRWLQLDEGAPELAHFATAVLRPVVTE